jgi:MioC protein
MSSERIGIFVASVTGLADICAEEIAAALDAVGAANETKRMDGLDVEALAGFDTILIVSSTYGHGDIPDNGQALFESIEQCDSLTGKKFLVFGLGDRTFSDTFCRAGERWDELLESKGAIRLAPLERHDACAGTLAEDEAAAWAARWAATLKLAA